MSDWIAVIEDEARTKLKAMEVFTQIRETRLLAEHDAGAMWRCRAPTHGGNN
jgi:hypothetical protein